MWWHVRALTGSSRMFLKFLLRICSPCLNFIQKTALKPMYLLFADKRRRNSSNILTISRLLSLTLELRSSNEKMLTYCCLTVHFIDDGWQLKKKILAFRNLRYNYDMRIVHEFIKSVLVEWRINKNVRFILLDITPPKKHMIGELRGKVSDKAPLVHGHLFCVSSYAQILSLLVQDVFFEIRCLLYKIRECIEYVNGSSLGRQRFQKAINNGSLQNKEMPFQNVPARWDTSFLMLESSLEFREAFNHLEQFDHDFKVNPFAEEWNKATSICECLKEFHKSTTSLTLGISVVLNSSFKLDLVEYDYQHIYGIDDYFHFSKFCDDVTSEYLKYTKDLSDQGPSSSSAMVDVSLCPSSNISFKEWRKGKHELNQYLKQPLKQLDKDGKILAWWQENAQKFPILRKIARDFLAIPISTRISKSSEIYGSDANLFLPRLHNDLKRVCHRYANDSSNLAASTSTLADVNCCTSFNPTSSEYMLRIQGVAEAYI
ncbi:hypothetical protein SADUNF_Sadunf16G0024200 [Salix dunnii]|uniref:HAT C-terminal dimerisation domain-containing protein n=1 Tax=Salix dunnii TaxID=1413687 RepID=A0A835MFT5_9ROSI|nr:hypothetical protein SADUNF_Sadunf16G0024200 [Salix dunnii]